MRKPNPLFPEELEQEKRTDAETSAPNQTKQTGNMYHGVKRPSIELTEEECSENMSFLDCERLFLERNHLTDKWKPPTVDEVHPKNRNRTKVFLDLLFKSQQVAKSFSERLLAACLTAIQMKDLDVKDNPPTIGDWFKSGDIGYVFASRGVGKTWFSMEMANAISSGRKFGPWEVRQAQRVLYIDGEVSLRDSKGRSIALEINNDNFVYLHHEHLYNTSGDTLDIANRGQQEAFLEICKDIGAKVVILDNLSCLAPYLDENEGFSFSNSLLNFILNMRRSGISVVFIQHAGRNGQMRGHSRREDAANWIIRLDESKDAENVVGAKFLSTFIKNRNAAKVPTTYEWHFQPNGNKTIPTIKEMDPFSMFRSIIESGVTHNKEIAEAMGMESYNISRLASRAMDEGWLKKNGSSYAIDTKGKGAKPNAKSATFKG